MGLPIHVSYQVMRQDGQIIIPAGRHLTVVGNGMRSDSFCTCTAAFNKSPYLHLHLPPLCLCSVLLLPYYLYTLCRFLFYIMVMVPVVKRKVESETSYWGEFPNPLVPQKVW